MKCGNMLVPSSSRVGTEIAVLHEAILEEGVSVDLAHHVKVERIPGSHSQEPPDLRTQDRHKLARTTCPSCSLGPCGRPWPQPPGNGSPAHT